MAVRQETQYIMNLSHDQFATVNSGTQYISKQLKDLSNAEVNYVVDVFTAHKTSGLKAQSLIVNVTISQPRTLAGVYTAF